MRVWLRPPHRSRETLCVSAAWLSFSHSLPDTPSDSAMKPFSRSLRKQAKRNRIRHGAIPCRGRMQMIAAIVSRQQLIGMLRVGHNLVEIDHRIEVPIGSNPPVHSLAVRLAQRPRMIVLRAHIRCDGSSEDTNTVCMRACNDLLVSS